MSLKDILGIKTPEPAPQSIGQQLKAYYVEKKASPRTDAERSTWLIDRYLKQCQAQGIKELDGACFLIPIAEYEEDIKKKMTEEEREQLRTSGDFFTGTQAYRRRTGEASYVNYQLFRGANIDTVIEMVNAGADDFNQADGWKDKADQKGIRTPSILLAHQFRNAMSELLECVGTFQTSGYKTIDFTAERGRYIKRDWERLNDILYIYNKLKDNHNGELNTQVIQAWNTANPKDHIQETLEQMDKFAQIPEQDREFYVPPQPTRKKGNLLGAWLGLRKGSRGGRNS